MKKTLIFISLFIFVLGLGCIYAADPNTATNTVSKPTFNYNIEYRVPNNSTQNQQSYDITEMVYITRTGKCYHKGYCSHAKKSAGYMSQSQAKKKGYRPCHYCCY